MKLQIGQKVKLKNRRGSNWNDKGEMDKYMDQIVTIKEFIEDGNKFHIKEVKGEICDWIFKLDDIESTIKQTPELIIFN